MIILGKYIYYITFLFFTTFLTLYTPPPVPLPCNDVDDVGDCCDVVVGEIDDEDDDIRSSSAMAS